MQPDPEYIMLDLPDGMPPVCCAVRRSLKAKRFFLRVIPHPFSVQLVIPKRRSVASGRKFAESKAAWLAATIRRLAPEPGAMPRGPDVPRRIPAEIELRLTGERLAITIEETPGAESVRCWFDPLFRQITMRGDPADGKAFAGAFFSVLTQIAEPVLTARIRAHAAALVLLRLLDIFRIFIRKLVRSFADKAACRAENGYGNYQSFHGGVFTV